jgi:ParB family chromosome partitioning protein
MPDKAQPQRALGRGLGALITTSRAKADVASKAFSLDHERVFKIRLAEIAVNPWQPRTHVDQQALEELTESIRQHGILQPLIVTPHERGYQLIAGERRLRAAKALGLATVPAIVRDASTQEKLEIALIENLQRHDLNPMEEARAYKRLMEEFNLTQEKVGERVGRKRVTVAQYLRLLSLPTDIQESLSQGEITMGHAKVILAANGEAAQRELFQRIRTKGLTVRAGEASMPVAAHRRRRTSADPVVLELEETLRETLGAPVKIRGTGRRGKIEIEYFSLEDLRALSRKLKG